jgi:hypothetical protein
MRYATTAVLLAFVLAGTVRGHADEASTTSTTQPLPPMTHETTVDGTAPDIAGRWLLLTSVGIGTSAKKILASVLDVRRSDDRLEIRERHVVLPPAQKEALRRGNEELGGVWAPTASDLDAIERAWDSLEIEERGIAKMTHQVTGRDAFDDDLKNDALTKDALWVIRQSYVFFPGGSRPTNHANLIAPLRREDDGGYSGNYLAVAVAAAPFPIPIKFEGTFRLIPIGRTRSWWARIGDFFAGCSSR